MEEIVEARCIITCVKPINWSLRDVVSARDVVLHPCSPASDNQFPVGLPCVEAAIDSMVTFSQISQTGLRAEDCLSIVPYGHFDGHCSASRFWTAGMKEDYSGRSGKPFQNL